MRVVAQVLLLDLDARELLLALADVVEGRAVDRGLDRDVRVRQLGDALDHALVDPVGLDADDVPEAPVQAAQLDLVGGQRRDRHRPGLAGRAGQPAALAALALGRAVPALADVAFERVQLVGGGQPGLLGLTALLAERIRLGDHRVRERAGDDLHDRRDPRLDQHAAVAVDDVAARRLDPDLADAVLARLGDVVLARQHLQEPQAEEDDREQHEREAAEHGDAHRELRRDRRAALLDGRRHQTVDLAGRVTAGRFVGSAVMPWRAGRARRSCTRGGGGGAGRRAGTAPSRGGRSRTPAAPAAC